VTINGQKYPAEFVKGKASRYTEYPRASSV
jgi:hypothetical protein